MLKSLIYNVVVKYYFFYFVNYIIVCLFMLVSVCIATYNGERYIREQILSILPQLSDDDEIVVSDDGSLDNTLAILESIDDSRIKIIKKYGEHGYTSNFENALKHSKGDVIFLCDQDDIWIENKVEIMLEHLKFADMVISDAIVVNEKLKVLHNSFWKLVSPYRSAMGNWFRFSYLGCCMCFKRIVLIRALPFPYKHKYATHDNWLCLVALFYFKVYYENQPLILYRRHTGSISTGGLEKSKTSFFFKIAYRLYLLWNLLLINKKSE